MSKLERVAAAICCPNGCKDAALRDGLGCESHAFEDEARAVLRELREPDEAMWSAMFDATPQSDRITSQWQAGIDAILGGE